MALCLLLLLSCLLLVSTRTVARGAGDESPAGSRGEQAVITEANAESFSRDAIILAARLAQEPWISADTAARLDVDLAQIRARFSQVQDVHASADTTMTELALALDIDAPWLEAWKAGRLTTGDGTVDGLLREFRASALDDFYAYRSPDSIQWEEQNRHHHTFYLTFAQPLNMHILAQRVQTASPHFHWVEPNGLLGDGDQIRFEPDGSSKRYTFSQGWGDCPAGCIHRHYWEVTLLPDSALGLREYGDPLPPPPPPPPAPVPASTGPSPAWAAKTAMPTPRSGLGVAAAPNGRIYAIGGSGPKREQPATPPWPEWAEAAVEEYDPATDTWTSRRPMAHPRAYLAVVAAGNGKLYAIGGRSSSGTSAAVAVEAYDPDTDTWTTKTSLPGPREGMGAATSNGKLYVIGKDTLEYDPATDIWTARASLPTPRSYPAVVAASNGRIYVIGGCCRRVPGGLASDGAVLLMEFESVEEYDPASDSWTDRASMPYPIRSGLGAAVASNGTIYAIGGGTDAQGNYVGATAAYDPASDTWTAKAGLPTPRIHLGVAAASNGKVYAIGGKGDGPDVLATVEEYDPALDP